MAADTSPTSTLLSSFATSGVGGDKGGGGNTSLALFSFLANRGFDELLLWVDAFLVAGISLLLLPMLLPSVRLLSYAFPEGQENFEDGSEDCAVAEVVVVSVAAADAVSLRTDAFEGLYLPRNWVESVLMTDVLCYLENGVVYL